MVVDLNYVPKGWKKVKIPKVLFFQEGPGVRNWQFTETGVKLLNVGNINNGKIDLSKTSIHLSEVEANGKYKHFLVDEGDLLIACSGIVVDNFHNKIAFAEKEHLPLCLNTSTMRFKALNDEVDLNYFKYYLQTVHFAAQLRKLITGSAQLNFGPSHIKKIDLLLPPLETQKRIAQILDDAAAMRDKTEQLLKEYDALAQSIFLDMFGDPVRNPKGWEKRKLELFGNWRSGGTPSRSNEKYFQGNIPWVTSGELNEMYIENSKESITDEALKNSSAHLITPGSLLLGMYDTAALKSSINKVDLTCNQAIAFAKLNENVNVLYVYYNIQYGKEYYKSQQRGVRQKNLNLSIIKNLEINYPPIDLQNQFAEKIALIERQKELAKQELKESEDLFNCLLQKAFKGELV